MENINRLEASVHSLAEGAVKLKKELDRAYKDAEQTQKDLNDARETIKELKLHMKKLENSTKEYQGFENKKQVIIDTINSILIRLRNVTHIDNITNEQC